ncbi:hypothetical protein HVA01_30840 [Halovibrio variabilis]|uniref:Uncharacterized protein n=1 Tax=Halovibrio variabilis TaxID=31910 RepID=A0A511UUR2_9GAMM|nr:hypothetical protein HVA01_30840 [Halovibrio variabilis]
MSAEEVMLCEALLKVLQEREDHELYYFDESGFSQSSSVPYAWSAIGKLKQVQAGA